MSKIEKTVFISYRRTNIGFALAVYQNLTHQGYDVFLDYTGIDSGNFEQVIIENIKSRAHFIVILTLSALERVHEPNDWLRREIETAIDLKRNIVPLTFENFDWKLAREKYLTEKLAALSGYNELPVPIPYFMEAMDRLHKRYLNIPLNLVLHPVSVQVEQATEAKQLVTEAQPTVSTAALTAEEWFEKGLASTDSSEKIRLYSEVLGLNPNHAIAYGNRGIAKRRLGDIAGAIHDASEAIRLDSNYAAAYNHRGVAKRHLGDYAGAIADYDQAIHIDSNYAAAYNHRGVAKRHLRDYAGAIADYDQAIHIDSYYHTSYNNRGETHFILGQYDNALADFDRGYQLKPGHKYAVGGLAVTLHKLDDVAKAINLWKILCNLDAQYWDADWAAKTLNWHESLREEARLLVAKL